MKMGIFLFTIFAQMSFASDCNFWFGTGEKMLDRLNFTLPNPKLRQKVGQVLSDHLADVTRNSPQWRADFLKRIAEKKTQSAKFDSRFAGTYTEQNDKVDLNESLPNDLRYLLTLTHELGHADYHAGKTPPLLRSLLSSLIPFKRTLTKDENHAVAAEQLFMHRLIRDLNANELADLCLGELNVAPKSKQHLINFYEKLKEGRIQDLDVELIKVKSLLFLDPNIKQAAELRRTDLLKGITESGNRVHSNLEDIQREHIMNPIYKTRIWADRLLNTLTLAAWTGGAIVSYVFLDMLLEAQSEE